MRLKGETLFIRAPDEEGSTFEMRKPHSKLIGITWVLLLVRLLDFINIPDYTYFYEYTGVHLIVNK